MYVFVFNARFQMMEPSDYVLMIFSGLVPFIGFQEALANTNCVVGNASLMKNTLFPIELVPVKTILTSQPTQISGFVLILLALGVFGKTSKYAALLPVVWGLQILFNIGFLWVFSSLDVIFRDLQNIAGILTIFLMMVSPIAYPATMVPENLQPFLRLNPLYYIISCYQDVLIFQRLPRMSLFIPNVIMSFGLFILGYAFFMRLKGVFIDNV